MELGVFDLGEAFQVGPLPGPGILEQGPLARAALGHRQRVRGRFGGYHCVGVCCAHLMRPFTLPWTGACLLTAQGLLVDLPTQPTGFPMGWLDTSYRGIV